MGKTGYVIDASIALKLVIAEPGTDEARALVGKADTLVAPELFLVEVASGLWANHRRGVITAESARIGLELIAQAGIEFVADGQLIDRALALATEIDHPIYDCLYLALALDEDIPVVTADSRFLASVAKSAHAGRVMDLAAALAP